MPCMLIHWNTLYYTGLNWSVSEHSHDVLTTTLITPQQIQSVPYCFDRTFPQPASFSITLHPTLLIQVDDFHLCNGEFLFIHTTSFSLFSLYLSLILFSHYLPTSILIVETRLESTIPDMERTYDLPASMKSQGIVYGTYISNKWGKLRNFLLRKFVIKNIFSDNFLHI